MMGVMILRRTRDALRLAEQAFNELSACARDTESEKFRDEFVSCIAMIGRVGPMIYSETDGCRTIAFGNWWEKTKHDPLLSFIKDVRNAEFKRGDNRKNFHHYRYVYNSAPAIDRVGKQLSGKPPGTSSATPLQVQPDTRGTDVSLWFFRGGHYDGQEVIPLLRRHLDWLGQTIIPEAERLLT